MQVFMHINISDNKKPTRGLVFLFNVTKLSLVRCAAFGTWERNHITYVTHTGNISN